MTPKTKKSKWPNPDGGFMYSLTVDDGAYGAGKETVVTLAEFLAEVRKTYPGIPNDRLTVHAAVELDYDDIEATGLAVNYAAEKAIPTDAEFVDEPARLASERAAELAERQKQNDEADRLSKEFDPFDK